MNSPELKKTFVLAHEQIKTTHAFIADMRPIGEQPGVAQCLLFLSIAEAHESATLLFEAGLTTHGITHVRSMMEALCDLKLLGSCGDHYRRMEYNKEKGALRQIGRMLESDNVTDDQRLRFSPIHSKSKERYDELHKEFKVKVSQIDLFGRAKLDFLVEHYILLCSFTHNDLAALQFRHVGPDGLVHRAQLTFNDTFAFVSLSSEVLKLAIHAIADASKIEEGQFNTHASTFARIQSRMMELAPNIGS